MRNYIIKRLAYSVVIAWGILTVTFILLRLGPGSPADKYLANIAARGGNVAEVIANIEEIYGLNKALYEQYWDYLVNLVRGDWGWSTSTSMRVCGERLRTAPMQSTKCRAPPSRKSSRSTLVMTT